MNMMSKKIWIFLLVFLFAILLESFSNAKEQDSTDVSVKTQRDTLSSVTKQRDFPANIDSVLVIHFHPTVQCSCCINVGNFAKKGLEIYYPEASKDGRIIFKEYDIDEDISTAKKYKIFWSALGFEKFSPKKNEFKEIESVWEFCEEEKKFLLNFRNELDQFIRILKKDKVQTKPEVRKVNENK